MDCTSAHDVSSRAYSWKERNNKSRNCSGFHVFLSLFFYDFKRLPKEEKLQRVKLFLLPGSPSQLPDEHDNKNSDDSSFDSTDTRENDNDDDDYVLRHIHVFRYACSEWNNNTSEDIKRAWGDRAKYLNSRRVPGKFSRVRNVIGGGGGKN